MTIWANSNRGTYGSISARHSTDTLRPPIAATASP